MSRPGKRSSLAIIGGAFLSAIVALGLCAAFLVFYPDSPLPPEWNPREPLNVTDRATPVTAWKLSRSLADREMCLQALATGAEFDQLEDFEASEQCHIRPQVELRQMLDTELVPLRTRCQTALRTAMWLRHGVKPAAQAHFGQSVKTLHHQSSYNCRAIRTGGAEQTRMSTHATADAIDVSGFTLADGTKVMLKEGWNLPDTAQQAFFRDIRDSACTWFKTTLGPDFNSLHADHFHLQNVGWGTCR